VALSVGNLLVGQGDHEPPTLLHRLDGVDHEILHHLPDLPLVHIGRAEIVCDPVLATSFRTMQGKLGDLADDILQQHRGPQRIPPFRKRQKLLGQIAGPQHAFLGLRQPPPQR